MARIILAAGLLVLIIGAAIWLGAMPDYTPGALQRDVASSQTASATPLRIGVVPERDIFAQHRRYRVLADYLSLKLDRPVEIATLNTYQAVLDDFRDKQIDAAFLGSLVALLAHDRLGAQVLLKPETDGVSTYRGVIFVRDDSPIRAIADLAGKSVAMVKTTTAGDLFATLVFKQAGLLSGDHAARLIWMGTHDEVVRGVVDGTVDAGAAKDLRIQAYLRENTAIRLRELVVSDPVPNNALVVRADVAAELGPPLSQVLLSMSDDPRGRTALAAFGAQRFIPCQPCGFDAIYRMIQQLDGEWDRLGIPGPPPSQNRTGTTSVALQPAPNVPAEPASPGARIAPAVSEPAPAAAPRQR